MSRLFRDWNPQKVVSYTIHSWWSPALASWLEDTLKVWGKNTNWNNTKVIIDPSGDEQIPANQSVSVKIPKQKLDQSLYIQTPFEVRYLNPQNISWEGFVRGSTLTPNLTRYDWMIWDVGIYPQHLQTPPNKHHNSKKNIRKQHSSRFHPKHPNTKTEKVDLEPPN